MKFLRKSIYRTLIFIISFILILFLLNFYKKEVKNFFYKISEPIQKFFWQAGINTSNFFETISEIKKLKKENEELKLRNQELLAQITALKELKKENEMLREALKLDLAKEFKFSLSQVIGKDIGQDFIVVNKGSEDGLSKNLPVINEQKILIGKVSEVYKNYSKVMLISNKESLIDGKIVEKEILGIIKGEEGNKVIFDYLQPEKEILEGDLIETSALGGVFPKGILVGQIQKIKKSDVQPFWQAEILPFFDSKNLENVFIILKF